MTINELAEKILITAISQGMCSTTAGRSLGLTALAHDARVAAQVLLGESSINQHPAPRPADAPPIGRPRKIRMYTEEERKNLSSSSENLPTVSTKE